MKFFREVKSVFIGFLIVFVILFLNGLQISDAPTVLCVEAVVLALLWVEYVDQEDENLKGIKNEPSQSA